MESAFSYSYSRYENTIITLTVNYDTSYSDIPAAVQRYEAAVAKALDMVDGSMSDLEKALVLHDYLAQHCEYDYDRLMDKTIPRRSYSAYGTLVEQISVCQGYMLAYTDLLRRCGVSACDATSESMNHTWNLVCIDDEWYHVDVTWDDPTNDLPGRVNHVFFLNSDSGIEDHSGWLPAGMCPDTRYDADSWYWKGVNSGIFIENGRAYYLLYNGGQGTRKRGFDFMERDLMADTAAVKYPYECTWNVYGNPSSYYPGCYGRLVKENGIYYFNDKEKVYGWVPDMPAPGVVYYGDLLGGYIFGLSVSGNTAKLAVGPNPNDADDIVTVTLGDITLLGTGTCGAHLTWKLDRNGALTISGTGAMDDYAAETAPWSAFSAQITEVMLESGITTIGSSAFAGCDALESIQIPSSVTAIGALAFSDCSSLQAARFMGKETAWQAVSVGTGNDALVDHISWMNYVLGDVNDDNKIDVTDAYLIRRAVAHLITLDDTQTLAADVDGSGTVDVTDAYLVRRYVARLISRFPADQPVA